MIPPRTTVLVRAALLWTAVSGVTAGLVALAWPAATGLARSPGADFATLLVQLCAVVGTIAALVLWLITTDVVRQVSASHSGIKQPRPGPLRTMLLTLCGVSALTCSTTATASGHPSPEAPLPSDTLEGLPLPDRATGELPPGEPGSDHRQVVRVRPGDSLWAIASRTLGPNPTATEVATYCRRIHAVNAEVIGADPDLIRPRQQLRLPPAP